MSFGSDIAAEIAAALAEGSAAVGDGPLVVTIVRQGAKSGPASAPTYGPDIEFSVNALLGEYTVFERSTGLIDDTDIKITVAAGQGVTPTNADTVRLLGDVEPKQIKRVSPFNPGGETLLFELQVKS